LIFFAHMAGGVYQVVAAIDRKGAADLIRDVLLADTSVLYGDTKLVQAISSDPVEYIEAKVNIRKPFKLFVVCEDERTVEYGTQNSRVQFDIGYRVEGKQADPENARDTIDDIDNRIRDLINTQMFGGRQFVDYYSDTSNRVVDAEYDNASLVVEQRGDRVAVECSGAIVLTVICYSS
jgi:hypothetical protein